MTGTIYWKYDYYRGGLGDFVRGALNTYAFCLGRGLNFAIWIPTHPLISCFDLPAVDPRNISTTLMIDASDINHRLLGIIYDYNPNEEIVLITNADNLATEHSLKVAVPTFRDRLLQPSAAVKARIAKLYSQLNVAGPRTYVSLHMRCGDAFMRNYDRYCADDSRCAPDQAVIKVVAAINTIKQKTSLPIIFHTDNSSLRDAITSICTVMPTQIQHTAQHSESGSAADYYDSVAEFFIIGQAKKVYYIVPSGFTKWSTMLFDTPLERILCD